MSDQPLGSMTPAETRAAQEQVKPTFPPVEHSMARYQAALYGMQTGVMMLMGEKGYQKETEPKHLRVGINSAMVEHTALVILLIRHGVIDEREWFDALATAMEAERDDYQKRVNKALGTDTVRLG